MSGLDIALYGALGLIVIGMTLLVVYGLTYLLFGRHRYSEDKTVTAKVLATSFHPERTHTGTGIGMVGGQLGTVFTSSTEDEEDVVLLRSKETGRISIDSADLLDIVTQGDTVELTYRDKYFYWAWNPSEEEMTEHVPVLVITKDGETVKF